MGALGPLRGSPIVARRSTRDPLGRMKNDLCPLCNSELEVREVAPCEECGGDPKEIEEFQSGVHTYAVYAIPPGPNLTLCDFCAEDFGGFDPEFFGLERGDELSPKICESQTERQLLAIATGNFCVACGFRQPFLKFVADVRRCHAA